MAARSPKGEHLMTAGFIVVRRRSTGPPAVIAGPQCDRRRDIGGASADNFVICRENRLVVEQSSGGGRQATAGWFYDIVQGQENRPTSYRSRKIGIRQKSSGHRWIYVFLGRRLKYELSSLGVDNNSSILRKCPTIWNNLMQKYIHGTHMEKIWRGTMNLPCLKIHYLSLSLYH